MFLVVIKIFLLTSLIYYGKLISIMRLVRCSKMEKILKVLADPVSNRILQMIRVRKKMTISDILSENTNTPRATVYRKIEKMLEVGVIEIIDSHKVRGQIENVYAVKKIYITGSDNAEDSMKLITISIMQILDQYSQYFQSENVDVNRDKLFLLNYAISLSDKDFSEMMSDILKIVDKYQKKKSTNDSKLRNLYLLSAPGGENNE